MNWPSLILGLFIGAALGITVMCLFVSGSNADDAIERFYGCADRLRPLTDAQIEEAVKRARNANN